MKKINKAAFYALLLCIAFALCLSGCGDKSGGTIDEPDITSEYLTEEYAQQLITDGAEVLTGYVEIADNDTSYSVYIDEHDVVPNSSYEKGYYIADTNLEKNVSAHSGTRIVCQHDNELDVTTVEEFISEHEDEDNTLYTVYLMGNSAELLVFTEPENLIE